MAGAYTEGNGTVFTLVHGEEPLPLLFIFAVLLFGAICKHTLSRLPMPYTCVLLLLGATIGLITEEDTSFGRSAKYLAETDPHLILYVFLPPLIFESSFSIEWHMFKNTGFSSLIAAVPGLMFGTMLTSLVMSVIYPDWDPIMTLLFGAIVSATDPVAVVALLKDVGAPAALGAFIEGESLLNDGTAMVAFTILHDAAKIGRIELGFADILWAFVRMSIGGPLFGFCLGFVLVKWIGYVFNDALVEITATITAAYLCFFLAEFYLGMSGVLAVVALGLLFGSVGRTSISPEVEHFLQEFWELLGYLANTLIFVLTGLIIVLNNVQDLTVADLLYLAVIYISINVIRFMMLMGCFPAISKIGYGMDYKGVLVGAWGGLRGAVSLSLALVIFQDEKVRNVAGDAVTDRILFHCSGIVMLTLLINATTMKTLLSWLGMDKVAHSKEVLFNLAMKEIENAGKREETQLKLNPIYSCARWRDVRHFKFKVDKVKVRRLDGNASAWEIDQAEREEARRRFLVAVKSSYWQQFKDGILGRDAVRELNELTDRSLDNLSDMSEWDGLHKMLSVSKSSHVAHRFINVPGFQTITRRFLFHRLQYGYDCVTSFVVARQDALKKINETLNSETLFGEIKNHAYSDIAKAKKALFDIQRVLPEISASIATNAAARCVLNSQRRAVHHLLHDGLLDVKEAERVIVAVETQMKRLLYTPPSMKLPEKDQLLGEVPFLAGLSKDVKQLVLDKATEEMFEEGDKVVRCGDTDDDVYVIARGTVRVVSGSGSDAVVMDELGVGSLIGEMSWVTGSPRFATVIASSPVICFRLRGNDLREIVKLAKGMETELWYTAGCRIAENMLAQRPPYSYWNRSNLRSWIANKWELFTPGLDALVKTFREPIVLIHGSVEILPLTKDAAAQERQAASAHASAPPAADETHQYAHKSPSRSGLHMPRFNIHRRKKRYQDDDSSLESGESPKSQRTQGGLGVHRAPFLVQPRHGSTMFRVAFSTDSRVLMPRNSMVNEKAHGLWKLGMKRVTEHSTRTDNVGEKSRTLVGVAESLKMMRDSVNSKFSTQGSAGIGNAKVTPAPTEESQEIAIVEEEPRGPEAPQPVERQGVGLVLLPPNLQMSKQTVGHAQQPACGEKKEENRSSEDPKVSMDDRSSEDPKVSMDNRSSEDPKVSMDNRSSEDPKVSMDNREDPKVSMDNRSSEDPKVSMESDRSNEMNTSTVKKEKSVLTTESLPPI